MGMACRNFARCRHWGIEAFSTPFDESAVNYLEYLEVPFYKVASFENTDLPLLAAIAKTGKASHYVYWYGTNK